MVDSLLEAKFWRNVDKRGPDECWPWLAFLCRGGYGRVRFKNVRTAATHISLEIDGRPRPPAPGDHALHSCDNRKCVNPAHLRWGTHQDNMRDMIQRGRQARKAGRRVLRRLFREKYTPAQIDLVLNTNLPPSALEDVLGIPKKAVISIRRRRHLFG